MKRTISSEELGKLNTEGHVIHINGRYYVAVEVTDEDEVEKAPPRGTVKVETQDVKKAST